MKAFLVHTQPERERVVFQLGVSLLRKPTEIHRVVRSGLLLFTSLRVRDTSEFVAVRSYKRIYSVQRDDVTGLMYVTVR